MVRSRTSTYDQRVLRLTVLTILDAHLHLGKISRKGLLPTLSYLQKSARFFIKFLSIRLFFWGKWSIKSGNDVGGGRYVTNRQEKWRA
jgi:hypothetical protein